MGWPLDGSGTGLHGRGVSPGRFPRRKTDQFSFNYIDLKFEEEGTTQRGLRARTRTWPALVALDFHLTTARKEAKKEVRPCVRCNLAQIERQTVVRPGGFCWGLTRIEVIRSFALTSLGAIHSVPPAFVPYILPWPFISREAQEKQ